MDSCQELQETGVFRSKFTRLHQAFAQGLQAQINEEVLNTLLDVESDDLNRFGKVRDAWEKELCDPDDVFFHAEERKKQLAKQQEKTDRQKASGLNHFSRYADDRGRGGAQASQPVNAA